ncbi:MAG: CHAT domain-containing protein [Acidobacteriota bacterium]
MHLIHGKFNSVYGFFSKRADYSFSMPIRVRQSLSMLCVALAIGLTPGHGASSAKDPHSILDQADRYAWLENWEKARPLYASAEEEYKFRGDVKKALMAKIGFIQSRLWTTSCRQLALLLDQEFKNPIVNQDLQLKLRCLVARAYVEEHPNLLAERDAWMAVLEIAKHTRDKKWENRASGQLGVLMWVMDINSLAAARRVGRALVEAIKSDDYALQVQFFEHTGNVLTTIKRYEAAMNYFQKALASASMHKDCPFPYRVYVAKARTLLLMGKHKESETLIDKALQQSKGNLCATAELLIVRARAASRSDIRRAIADLNEARDICLENDFDRALADANEQLAKMYGALGDYEKAEEYQRGCVEVTRKRHERSSLAERLSKLAEICVQLGRIADAVALYEQGANLNEELLLHSISPYAKASLIDWLSDSYLNHCKLALNHLKDPTQAWTILERARGRSIAESIRNKSVETVNDDSTKELYRELSRLNSKVLEARTAEEGQELLDQLFVAEEAQIPAIAERNASLRREIVKPVAIDRLQAILQNDEMIVEFVLSDPQSYCLQITRQGIAASELTGRTELDNLIDQFLHDVRLKKDVKDSAGRLYQLLLGRINHLDHYKKIIIVPEGNLNLLPFESLIDNGGKLVLESHIISYVQSATLLHLLRTRPGSRRPQTQMLLALGDALYRKNSKYAIQRNAFPIDGYNLPRLLGTKEELLAIAQVFPGKTLLLTGKEATEDSLKSSPLNQFKIVHFAVHGYANLEFPERSALILTSNSQSEEDGLLQDREIHNLDLAADLVTLSACDSGVGKLHGQEGIANLVKAFMVAGAGTVVASLWNVDDTLTSKLMKSFYSNLAKGEGRASALRNAKLALIREEGTLSDYYWAGFILWGENLLPIDLIH